MLLTNLLLQIKLGREIIKKLLVTGLWFLHSVFPLIASFNVSSFIQIPSTLFKIGKEITMYSRTSVA